APSIRTIRSRNTFFSVRILALSPCILETPPVGKTIIIGHAREGAKTFLLRARALKCGGASPGRQLDHSRSSQDRRTLPIFSSLFRLGARFVRLDALEPIHRPAGGTCAVSARPTEPGFGDRNSRRCRRHGSHRGALRGRPRLHLYRGHAGSRVGDRGERERAPVQSPPRIAAPCL